MRSRCLALSRVAVLGAMLSACIALPGEGLDPVPSSCQENRDCGDAEICLNNQCYGDPPGGAFAVVVSPAGSDTNVAMRAYPNVTIPLDGALGEFALSEATVLAGVTQGMCDACAGVAPSALITFSQRGAFVGGPPNYQALALPLAAEGQFEFTVPADSSELQTASLAVVPTDTDERRFSAWLPPTRITLATPFSIFATIVALLDGESRSLVGTVTLDGKPAVGFTVSVAGRFGEDRPRERVSAVVRTDAQGAYELPISPLALAPAELVISPPAGVTAATYRVATVLGAATTTMPTVAVEALAATEIAITAAGFASSGTKLVPMAGRVVVEAHYTPIGLGEITAIYRSEATIESAGPTTLRVPTNANAYYVSLIHAGTGELGSMYRQPTSFAALQQELALPRRTAVSGRIVSANGIAADGATVTMEPSMDTLWNQPHEVQELVREQALATGLTAADGSFLVWVDTAWHAAGGWRLSINPSDTAAVALPRWATVIELGTSAARSIDIMLPGAAVVTASVAYPNGRAAARSRVTLYRVNSINPCLEAAYPPPSCELPEVVMASGETDDQGQVVLVVPTLPPAL